MEDLGTLPGGANEPDFSSGGTGINHQGHVSGWSWLDAAHNAAIVWTPKQGMEAITVLINSTSVGSINDSGQIVGSSDFYEQGFVWKRKSGTQELGPTLGSDFSSANGNNNRGEIVGSYTTGGAITVTHAYLLSKKLVWRI